jgi:hypothetical protein
MGLHTDDDDTLWQSKTRVLRFGVYFIWGSQMAEARVHSIIGVYISTDATATDSPARQSLVLDLVVQNSK